MKKKKKKKTEFTISHHRGGKYIHNSRQHYLKFDKLLALKASYMIAWHDRFLQLITKKTELQYPAFLFRFFYS